MMDRPPPRETTEAGKCRKVHYALLGTLCVLVIGLYAWSASSGRADLPGVSAENSYYNLLAQSFRLSQLHLQREVSSELAQQVESGAPLTKNPYWLMEQELLDLSYYGGKLYLYFGVTPVLVLFWPYALLTGRFLLHQTAVVIFFGVGFLASVALLWAVWRRYFAAVSWWVMAGGVLALGWANFTPAILQRCGVYEVAISCGYALAMVALLLLWRAMHLTFDAQHSTRNCLWLAGASGAYGLAVAARPSLLLGAVILLIPVAAMIFRQNEGGRIIWSSSFWKWVLAASGPITVIGMGLLFYNYLRFGDPVEFGQRYQLPLSWHQQFGLHFLWSNFQVCFLEPARWSSYFPFVQEIALPVLPQGSGDVSEAFGVVSNMPLVWLSLASPLAWHDRLARGCFLLHWFVGAVVVVFVTGALVLCLHDSVCLRYEVEFAGPLVWLAMVGILGLERALAGRPVWRVAVRSLWGLPLACSLIFNLFAAFKAASDSHVYRGVAFIQKGQLDEAVAELHKALRIHPDNWRAHASIWGALRQLDQEPQALWHLGEALRLRPDFAEGHSNLGAALFQQGKLPEALAHLKEALRLKPDYAEARFNLGAVLFRQAKVLEAITQWEVAVRLKSDSAEARRNLAWVLATCADGTVRNGGRAVELAQQADHLTGGNDARVLDTLAAAYAEAGRYEDAARTAQAAMELARITGQGERAQQIQARLQLYQAGKPYRDQIAPER